MASVKHEPCACPRRQKATCAHRPWLVTYREPGGRGGKQVEIKFKTREAADAFAVKVERDKDLGVYINPRAAKRLFSEIWEEWAGVGELEPGTVANYASVYKNHFADFFGSRQIGSIAPKDIAEWEKWQKAEGYKPYGIQTRRNILSSVFGYAVATDLIGKNPCRNANPRKTSGRSAYEPVRDEEIPTLAEVLGIIAEIPKPLRAAVWSMAGCGTRPGESLAICEPSIEWEAGTLLVNHQIATTGLSEITGSRRGLKRGTKHRSIGLSRRTPIPATVSEVLDDHIDRYGTWGDGWLFESPRKPGSHPSYDWLLRQFHKAAEGAGLPQYTPKSLRHFFVSSCLHARVPVYEVAQWVGHRDTRTTEAVYGHLVTRAYKRGADAMEKRLQGELEAFRGRIDRPEVVELDEEADDESAA